MSRLVLTQITIKKERSISSTTWYYLLQPSNASAPDSTNYGNPPPTYSTTGYSGWSNIEPTYVVGDDRVLYVMVQTLYSDGTFSYSTPSISSSYEAAKDAYDEIVQAESVIEQFEELGLKKGYIWDNATYTPASGSIPVYPIGTYIASGILVNGNRSITHSNSNTYGLNTWISTGGINLRYNAIDLMKLTTSNLEFYYPSTSSQQKKAISLGTNGAINSLAFYGFNSDNKTMELTNDGLYFYNPSDGSTELASFTTNGLVLNKGGIVAGTKGQTSYIYLSTVNHPVGTNGVTINDFTPTSSTEQWREVIGTKFGVTNAGTLYASNAVISGTITVGSGSTVDSGATIGGTSVSTVVSNANNGNTAYNRATAYRGTCSTAATTAAKVITSSNFPTLAQGITITVYNTTAQTVSGAITLNVNSTGAKTIYVNGAATSASNLLLWAANSSITFTYDGTYWRVQDNPGTYTGSNCTVTAGTAAKTTTINEVVIFKGTTVAVPMQYNNTATTPTLNVTSLGAKNIYYGINSTAGTNGPTVANGHSWVADTVANFMFDGAYWRLMGQTVINGDNIVTGTVSADYIDVSGIISAGSIVVGNDLNNYATTTAAQGYANTAEANASYSVEIEVSSIDFVNSNATLVAHPYFKGVKLTNSTTPALSTITGYSWSIADGTAIPSEITTNAKTLQLPNNSNLNATYVCTISKT